MKVSFHTHVNFLKFSLGMKHIPSLFPKGDASPAWSYLRVHQQDTDPVIAIQLSTLKNMSLRQPELNGYLNGEQEPVASSLL